MNEAQCDRDDVGRVFPRGNLTSSRQDAASGDAAYKATRPGDVGRVPSHGGPDPVSVKPPPRRLRRLQRVWLDRNGNISYLLTMCVDGRGRTLDNESIFGRLVAFLLDSPVRYHWFGRRFVVMPDHIHLIAHMGQDAHRLGQWIKALKAVVGGLERREPAPEAACGHAAYNTTPAVAGRVPTRDVPRPPADATPHEFARIKRIRVTNPV